MTIHSGQASSTTLAPINETAEDHVDDAAEARRDLRGVLVLELRIDAAEAKSSAAIASVKSASVETETIIVIAPTPKRRGC